MANHRAWGAATFFFAPRHDLEVEKLVITYASTIWKKWELIEARPEKSLKKPAGKNIAFPCTFRVPLHPDHKF
jgi:hypothetical protein